MHYHIAVMATIGENIKKLRKLRGLKQDELAKLLGVTQSTITGYETDYRKPDPKNLPKLARILGVSIDDLFGNIKIDPATKEEKNILHGNSRLSKIQEYFSKLPPSDQRFILKQAQTIAGNHRKIS